MISSLQRKVETNLSTRSVYMSWVVNERAHQSGKPSDLEKSLLLGCRPLVLRMRDLHASRRHHVRRNYMMQSDDETMGLQGVGTVHADRESLVESRS